MSVINREKIVRVWFGPFYDRLATVAAKNKDVNAPDVYRDTYQVEVEYDEFSKQTREATEQDKKSAAYRDFLDAEEFKKFKKDRRKADIKPTAPVALIPKLNEPVDTVPGHKDSAFTEEGDLKPEPKGKK